ncbi:spore germination protein GerW family protein [Actinotalea solisilvae]|uniref:spore germination protein GerW family protein n=1 Tax=Actinotalea solisilvae TaxID=2072922 RepID=UPI0018F167C7|nr:spore germination protein GerW family protein [Actinotalea solisilvae]
MTDARHDEDAHSEHSERRTDDDGLHGREARRRGAKARGGRGRPRGDRGRLVTRVAGDALHVRRVFGEPIREDGVTLVPVARVLGGAGSGWGSGELGAGTEAARSSGEGSGAGGGGGFGVRVRPLGVFVVRGTDVEWRPALDLGRVILGSQVVGALAVLVLARALRARRRRG